MLTYMKTISIDTEINNLFKEVTYLLQQFISTPSFSREEQDVADRMQHFLQQKGCTPNRKGNNIWVYNQYFSTAKPTLLLNSHIDTVKPVKAWQRNPFEATIKGDKLYGLGSNDAGGALMSLLATFLHFYDQPDLPYNLVFAATAEEEISGKNGIASILSELGKIEVAIVGEPTQMRLAIAEKGLVVMDGVATGKAGHAARKEGENAIYKALTDIQQLQEFTFPKISDLLGPVKVSVTQINAGYQHNVVPDECRFVVDVRTNEHYTNPEIVEMLQAQVRSKLSPRSLRLNSSGIAPDHPLIKAGQTLNMDCFGSPTLSDQALLPFPSIKIGPGKSARSHTADEFIYLSEIQQGIFKYIQLLKKYQVVISC